MHGDCRTLIAGGHSLQLVVATLSSSTWPMPGKAGGGAQGGIKASIAEVVQATLGPVVTM